MPGPVFLADDRVELRTVDPEDAETIREWMNHPDVRRHVHEYRLPKSEDTFEEGTFATVGGEDRADLLICDGDPVGVAGLSPIHEDRRSANLGCVVAPGNQGEGYGTAASELLVEYGFTELRLHRIGARTLETNRGARATLESAGFVEEGRRREAGIADGDYVDEVIYGLLRREWADDEGGE